MTQTTSASYTLHVFPVYEMLLVKSKESDTDSSVMVELPPLHRYRSKNLTEYWSFSYQFKLTMKEQLSELNGTVLVNFLHFLTESELVPQVQHLSILFYRLIKMY